MQAKREIKYDALIVEPDQTRRTRLKQAMFHEARFGGQKFGKINMTPSLRDATKILEGDENVDVVVLSYRLGEPEVHTFISHIKKTREFDVGFILLSPAGAEDNASMAMNVISGLDGVLFEPYSIDNLKEIVDIAERVRRGNDEARMMVASNLIIEGALNTIDAKAEQMKKTNKASPVKNQIKVALGAFRLLSDDAQDVFFDNLINAGEGRAGTTADDDYSGASERVKQKMKAETPEASKDGD